MYCFFVEMIYFQARVVKKFTDVVNNYLIKDEDSNGLIGQFRTKWRCCRSEVSSLSNITRNFLKFRIQKLRIRKLECKRGRKPSIASKKQGSKWVWPKQIITNGILKRLMGIGLGIAVKCLFENFVPSKLPVLSSRTQIFGAVRAAYSVLFLGSCVN